MKTQIKTQAEYNGLETTSNFNFVKIIGSLIILNLGQVHHESLVAQLLVRRGLRMFSLSHAYHPYHLCHDQIHLQLLLPEKKNIYISFWFGLFEFCL